MVGVLLLDWARDFECLARWKGEGYSKRVLLRDLDCSEV